MYPEVTKPVLARESFRFKGRALLSAALLLACGCKPDAAVRKGEVIDSGTKSTSQPGTAVTQSVINNTNVDVTTLGALTGTVVFRGAPPRPVRIDMSADPACAFGENSSEQVVVNNGKLANVYLFVKGIAPSLAPSGQPPVVMDQQGCRFLPHVIAVQQGGFVQFSNSDRTVHNVHMVTTVGGNPSLDVSQGPGAQPQSRQFPTPALMVPVRCNNHPWMNAFVNVADSPYFAVTGADGKFLIRGLPPGHYTLAAVHEKLGEQDISVTVLPRATGTINVAFGR